VALFPLSHPPDVLYRVKPGERNDQLRYSLRSLANVEHGQVYVVGHCPGWLVNVEYLAGSTERSKWRIVLDHLAIACRALPGRELLLVDDDMYFIEPVERWPILYAHGTLADQALRTLGSYSRTLYQTDRWLRGQGVAEPVSYELHVPLLLDADRAAEPLTRAVESGLALQGRSVYGNLAQIGGTAASDSKARRADPAHPGPVVSTGTESWQRWRGRLAQRFPHLSSFERDGQTLRQVQRGQGG
jgi:hypothetical protein